MCNTDSKTYISVGELAQKAGVTIRTLQFYDQKGLLVPSIKGSRNRRLYSEEDQERLYAILCYKYMGLSLDEIRVKLDSGAKPENMTDALQREASELEKNISNNMKRYAVIKDHDQFVRLVLARLQHFVRGRLQTLPVCFGNRIVSNGRSD